MKKQVSVLKAVGTGKNHILQCAVLIPMVVDLQGDWMTKEDIAESAYDFLSQYNKATHLKQQHQGNPISEKAEVVESFLVPDGNTITLGSQTYPEGTWIMSIRILDDELWANVESGAITGLSVGGKGVRIEMEP